MRYQVGIFPSATSPKEEVKRVVRAYNTDDAIASFVKAEDLPGAYAAYAYPIHSGRNAPISDDWRRRIRCSVTGKVFMQQGMPSLEGENRTA
jgi:hypothetical protein